MNGQADAPQGGGTGHGDATARPAGAAAPPDAGAERDGAGVEPAMAAGDDGRAHATADVAPAPADLQHDVRPDEPGAPADRAPPADAAGPAPATENDALRKPPGAEAAVEPGGRGATVAGTAAGASPAGQDAPSGDAQPAGADDDAPPDPALMAEAARIAEALIFASDRPVTPAMLGAVLPPGLAPGIVIAALAEACAGRGVLIAEVAGGWAFRTAPDLAQRLTKVVQAPRRLPRAAMEALSIIAYHQPCTRGEIEEIRGAALAQTTLEALLELGLVAPRGRREVPGRPTLWGTTPKFLEQFGLKALSDLPRKEELVTAETGPALPLGGPAAMSSAPLDEDAAEATTAVPPAATEDAAAPAIAPPAETADAAASTPASAQGEQAAAATGPAPGIR
ncbi:SMC-Scp complex subunit ScpB [Roseomonas sp. CECT 9278]|uniref:SMC-Scp complex subunit ScpB n=1 Tax=Roseomonas sp. CECT 9278 TaxID=2845823 RepID=UPI001E40F985|nr:SMC-Scp complex subunit ScpB [Roseomonas sp. CECT 9278]CAH0158870.1 Segregation and condensation protein B [Roseomonas sp. CECT 9278]